MAAITLNNLPHSLLNALQALFPATALSAWTITPLAGLGGGSYRLQYDEIDWVARHYHADKAALFVTVKKEYTVLTQLKNTELTSKIAHQYGRWLFLYWQQGVHLTHQQLFSTYLAPLAEKMATLHQQPPFGYPLDLKRQLRVHWYHIDRKRLTPKWLRLQQRFLRQPANKVIKYAPAHMDLHPDNILLSPSGIKFIDWEYAADSDIADSLMAFFAINQLDNQQQTDFLRYYCLYHYHQKSSESRLYYSIEQLKQRILSRKPFILYMMLMWYEVRWHQTKDNTYLHLSQPLRDYFGLIN